MGCGSASSSEVKEVPKEYKTINIIFKLSTGQEYNVTAKENELFQTVVNKFKLENPEINSKINNALCKDNKIDLNKTILENNIKENYSIILDVEEQENIEDNVKIEEEEDIEENLEIEYNPENVIWIDENVDNFENTGYLKELNSLGYNVQCFKNVDEGFDLVKSIKFESTKIIISGRLYFKFIQKFIDNLNEIYVIPKIIIFTRNREKFIQNNKINEDIINHPFFNFGGIRVIISDVIKFLKDEIVQNGVKRIKSDKNRYLNNNEILDNRLEKKDAAKLTFEYIDNNQKLTLPLFYKSLIDICDVDDIEKYTELIYSKYSENSGSITELLKPIKSIYDIPLELLCKYYARVYTIESDFYREINSDLRENKTAGYLPFIKVLYEGVKLQALNIASDIELYRGSKISLDEISKIKDYLNNKIENLPGALVFSKSFLSFSKERRIAENFLNFGTIDSNLRRVLYILEKDENIDYSLSTHTDVENISIFNLEKEVLFFPFSSFEIKDIKEIKGDEDENIYEIRLIYLGKYLKEIEKDVNIIEMENELPDSEFKKQILELGLLQKDKIKNTKQIFNNFKQFKNKVNNNGFKKYVVKKNPNVFKSVNEELFFKNKTTNILTRSYNRNNTFVKNKLSQSQMSNQNIKTQSYNERFTITTIDNGDYTIKVVNINVPNFLGEYLIPIWFEKGKYIKFNTEGKYRISKNYEYHDSFGLHSSMKFNYGSTIARIGSGESFALPSKEYIHFSKVEGPLYLKLNLPKNLSVKPEGKLKIKIYDGELMSRKEIYTKIGWKEKELKYDNEKSKVVENDLTVFLNNLRMNPILFYESYIKEDNKNQIWTRKFLEDMEKNNQANGIKPFSVNNNLYQLIYEYLEYSSENIKKKISKKNSIQFLQNFQDLLETYIKEKISQNIILNCKLIKKSEMKHICLQYVYDKDFIPNIFNKEYNSISINIRDDIIDDFYLIILCITNAVENDDNESQNMEDEK